jgi:hypothetical protein
MAGTNDIAWVADRIVACLKANLSAKLIALDIEYDDTITLEHVAADNFYITEVRLPAGFPLVCVIPDRTDNHPSDGFERYDIQTHSLTIAVAVTANQGEDKLKRMCLRTVRAIDEVLMTDSTLQEAVDSVIAIDKQYGPLLISGDAMMQEAQLRIEVGTSDNTVADVSDYVDIEPVDGNHRGAYTAPLILQGSSTLFVGLWVDNTDPANVLIRAKAGTTAASVVGTAINDPLSTAIKESLWVA